MVQWRQKVKPGPAGLKKKGPCINVYYISPRAWSRRYAAAAGAHRNSALPQNATNMSARRRVSALCTHLNPTAGGGADDDVETVPGKLALAGLLCAPQCHMHAQPALHLGCRCARVLRLCAGVAHYTSPESGARTLIRTLVQNDVTVCFTNPGTSEMVRDPRVLCPRCAAPQLFLMSRAALRRGP